MILTIVRIAAVIAVTIPYSVAALLVIPIDESGRMYHGLGRSWARLVLRLCGVRVRLKGREHLDPKCHYIYVANHASMFDIPAVMATIPDQIRIVLKKELTRVPIWGWALKHGPYISIDRSDAKGAMESLDRAARTIRHGASVLLFAEGTRTRDGNLQPFKRGAFALAAKSGVPIIPLTINNSFNILPKGSLRIRPTDIELVLGRPIPTDSRAGRDGEKKLMDEVHAIVSGNFKSPHAANEPHNG
ncbi:MAG: 1-acyl-sn-glycerol-3-phosphate acyltransferase [Ignavibacteria bacterium]|nr:1-acyl-sn-glycerol-3-phosphate acyltransferase [Ignavibacteria bacterium]